jgi:hypothetical protein
LIMAALSPERHIGRSALRTGGEISVRSTTAMCGVEPPPARASDRQSSSPPRAYAASASTANSLS